MLRFLLSLLTLSLSFGVLSAQTGCPGCVIDLPTLPEDTIYLSAAPDGEAGLPYDADLSFRLPLTTTPVNATDPTVPAGLDINEFTILAVAGLPAGLGWEASQTDFVPEEGTDGCVKLCGTPLLPGLYLVEVVVEAVVIVFPQQTSFSFPLLIEPAQTTTEGFTVTNNAGCGSVTASFTNNVPSNGAEGFSYLWFFGNGNSTTAEDPADQTYSQPGVYEVEYQAIVDTTGFFLTQVTIEATDCDDVFNASDLKFDLFDPNGEVVYTAPIVDNAQLPVTYDLLFPIGEGTYELHVIDDDGGIDGGDDLCGIIPFTQDANGQFSDGSLVVNLTLIHPVDTITSTETITVYEVPATPFVNILEDSPYCEGEAVHLISPNYEGGLAWYRDSLLLVEATNDTLTITQGGTYWATFVTPEGCSATSAPLSIEFTEPPADIDLLQSGNLLRLEDESNLPADFTFQWLYEGEVIPSATELLLCAEVAGTYTLVITDNVTGCSTSADLAATYDPNVDCTTSTEEGEEAVRWRVFPNPVQDDLYINGTAQAPVLAYIYDSWGRLQRRVDLRSGENHLDLGRFPAGAYFYHLYTTNGVLLQSGKLVKTK